MTTQSTELCKTERTNGGPSHAGYRPDVDIRASETGFEMAIELPGVSEDNVEVTIDKNVMTIHGHVEPPEFAGMSAIHREYGVGDYHRSFTLAEDIDHNSIDAELKNGLLTLKLKRREPVGPKKVQIKSQ